jgi:hypothetical protein
MLEMYCKVLPARIFAKLCCSLYLYCILDNVKTRVVLPVCMFQGGSVHWKVVTKESTPKRKCTRYLNRCRKFMTVLGERSSSTFEETQAYWFFGHCPSYCILKNTSIQHSGNLIYFCSQVRFNSVIEISSF